MYTKRWGSPGYQPGVFVDCRCGWRFETADPRCVEMVHAQIRLHKRECKRKLKPPPPRHEYSDGCDCFLCSGQRARAAYLKAAGLEETDRCRSSSASL